MDSLNNLFWFRNDLRVADNPGLTRMADGSRLLCVYIWPRDVPWCNTVGVGVQRQRFLLESLLSLRRTLRAQGQELLVSDEPAERLLPRLVRQHRIARIGTAADPGIYEAWEVHRVSRATGIAVETHPGNSLYAIALHPSGCHWSDPAVV